MKKYEQAATLSYYVHNNNDPSAPERPDSREDWKLVSSVRTDSGVVWYWQRRMLDDATTKELTPQEKETLEEQNS